MSYTYQYPHPAVTTDIVIFTVMNQALNVLLIERGEDPFKNNWAIPGGFLKMDESLDECASRELKEETSIEKVFLEQLATFGDVGRDPRERVISVAYYALTPFEGHDIKAGSDAANVKWYNVDELPDLAFDHAEIIKCARERLSAKMDYSTIGFQFMPDHFTLSELQNIYEIVMGKELDKRNFRKWILSLGLLEDTGEKKADGPYRPAKVYKLIEPEKVNIIK